MFPYGQPYGYPYAPTQYSPYVPQGPPRGGGGRGAGRGGRGRGRATQTARAASIVNTCKAVLGNATPGQLLEVGKWVAARLSRASPGLYAVHLKGLGLKEGKASSTPASATPQGEGGGSAQADAVLIASRRDRWKSLCREDPQVKFYYDMVARIKRERGANAAVDEIVSREGHDITESEVGRYYLGRSRKDTLLAECGLSREGSTLVLTDPPPNHASYDLDSVGGESSVGDDLEHLSQDPPQGGAFAYAAVPAASHPFHHMPPVAPHGTNLAVLKMLSGVDLYSAARRGMITMETVHSELKSRMGAEAQEPEVPPVGEATVPNSRRSSQGSVDDEAVEANGGVAGNNDQSSNATPAPGPVAEKK